MDQAAEEVLRVAAAIDVFLDPRLPGMVQLPSAQAVRHMKARGQHGPHALAYPIYRKLLVEQGGDQFARIALAIHVLFQPGLPGRIQWFIAHCETRTPGLFFRLKSLSSRRAGSSKRRAPKHLTTELLGLDRRVYPEERQRAVERLRSL